MEKTIKHIQVMALLALMLTLFNVETMAKKRMVERGMTKAQVEQVLGKPKTTSFDRYGDTWSFVKMLGISGDYKLIVVNFDQSGRVVSYQEQLVDSQQPQVNGGIVPVPVPQPPIYDGYPMQGQVYSMDDRDFNYLYNKVKSKSFDSDKFDLIDVASLGCYFTCGQCVRIMQLFTFDDDKLKALRPMARKIVDPQNAYSIYSLLTFDNNRDAAARMIQQQ